MWFEIAALAAAFTWALSGIVSATPSRHLGALGFNRLRMALVFVMLMSATLFTGGWETISMDAAGAIILSGIIGIFVGDTALFLTMNRLGPRRSGILFAMNAPISTALGWAFLGEVLSAQALVGIALAIVGVVLAIVFGKRPSQLHQWESVKGPLWQGIALGLIAALAQSLGSLIARPVMAAGADPIVMSALRVGVAALCLAALMQVPNPKFRQQNPLTWEIAGLVALSGFVAMGIGMTLILYALSGGEVGIVSTLSAASPALILPLLWWRTGERPAGAAWFGAALVVVGTALIFMD